MTAARQSNATQWRRTASQRRRDGALARVSSITGSVAIAIIAAVGVLGIYVAKALPGHHTSSSTGATSGAVTAGNSGSGASGSGVSTSINPPSSSPQAASSQPQVTSGST
ncbi:MAG TPA: hypothetical protein VNG12_15605 [Acidimicrobiales bacterium]|nr:hypothetical protein [Acidimicrobiales bacterium]